MHHEDEPQQETREIQPTQTNDHTTPPLEEPFSQFLAELQTRFGMNVDKDDAMICIRTIAKLLRERKDLAERLSMASPDEKLPIFGQAVKEILQSMLETYYRFYQQMKNNQSFADYFCRVLFERYQLRNKQ